MFGHSLVEDLVIQNCAAKDSQERFDYVVSYHDDPIDDLETYLANGYIIYDLLTDDQKWYCERNGL